MNLSQRSSQPELLDGNNIPFKDIQLNLKELNFINTWLGGHSITVKGLKKIIGNNKSVTICEVGCGGGDNLVALSKWCKKHGINAKFIGLDINMSCIKFARTRNELEENTTWFLINYKQVEFKHKPDIIFSSLFCHHFSNSELVEQLQWMQQQSTIGFFINDLERNPLAYYLIKLLTKIFSASYLVKNDAPLSVARSFKKSEWIALFKQAQLKPLAITWQWAFRYLVIHKNG